MIEVTPVSNVCGIYAAGADKSITVRAILFGAISSGITVISDALICSDTLAAVECARILGARAAVESNRKIVVKGTERIPDGKVFDCKNSGTTARLLIGLLCGAGVNATVTGDESLQKRPMSRVVLPLLKRGAAAECTCGCLPVNIHPGNIRDYEYELDLPSAQVKSALILSGVTGSAKTTVKERIKTRAHTEKLLAAFGAEVVTCGNVVTVYPCALKGINLNVPTDPSSAAFYLGLGLLKGEVTVKNVMLGCGRRGFYDKLKEAGASLTFENEHTSCGEPCADVTARKSDIKYMLVKEEELPSMIDEIPVLALIASRFNGLTVESASELKVKESDRLSAVCELINLSGGKASVNGDDLKVEGGANAKSFVYESADHRMTMTAFIAMYSGKGGKINGENVTEVSLPEFFTEFYEFRACLAGEDVSKSLSGNIHKFLAEQFGDKNYGYECISLDRKNAVQLFKKSGYKLINVTIPYKEDACFAVDAEQSARLSRSANCIANGKGYSFDGKGLIYALKDVGVCLRGKKVLVYGAGGAGRSIAFALEEQGALVYVKNRGAKRLNELISLAGKNRNIKKYVLGKCDVIINASSLKDKCPLSKSVIRASELVVDINYGEKTAFVALAERENVKYADGTAMLFYQAYLSEVCARSMEPDEVYARNLYEKWRSK